MAKIGDIEVLVTSESYVMINEVTQRRVEVGTITDNVKGVPDGVDISGTITSNGWEKLSKLRAYKDDATLITYQGKGTYHNMVIEGLEINYDAGNEDGFSFNLELTEVKIARTVLTEYEVAVEIQSQIKEITNAGLQTLRSG